MTKVVSFVITSKEAKLLSHYVVLKRAGVYRSWYGGARQNLNENLIKSLFFQAKFALMFIFAYQYRLLRILKAKAVYPRPILQKNNDIE
ncbi:MAG: hypothetical protein ACKVZH_25110 [Blastocatellia bacterium]